MRLQLRRHTTTSMISISLELKGLPALAIAQLTSSTISSAVRSLEWAGGPADAQQHLLSAPLGRFQPHTFAAARHLQINNSAWAFQGSVQYIVLLQPASSACMGVISQRRPPLDLIESFFACLCMTLASTSWDQGRTAPKKRDAGTCLRRIKWD